MREAFNKCWILLYKNLLKRIFYFNDLEGILFQQQQNILCTLGIFTENNDKSLFITLGQSTGYQKVLINKFSFISCMLFSFDSTSLFLDGEELEGQAEL